VLPHIPALIAGHMRAAAGRRSGGRTGPFLIGLDAHSDEPMRNYAVPDRGARPGAGDADALIAFFRPFRRRGIASALSAHLARTDHSQGISLVFLEAEPEEEQIYHRTGFTDATTKIWASIR
jgi:GNAT superfamily N-acetyltransferase